MYDAAEAILDKAAAAPRNSSAFWLGMMFKDHIVDLHSWLTTDKGHDKVPDLFLVLLHALDPDSAVLELSHITKAPRAIPNTVHMVTHRAIYTATKEESRLTFYVTITRLRKTDAEHDALAHKVMATVLRVGEFSVNTEYAERGGDRWLKTVDAFRSGV